MIARRIAIAALMLAASACGGRVEQTYAPLSDDAGQGAPDAASGDAGGAACVRCVRVDAPECRPYPGECFECEACSRIWGPDFRCVQSECTGG